MSAQTLIRCLVIAALVAIPVVGLSLLDDPSSARGAGTSGDATPAFVPPPLPRDDAGDGLTFVAPDGAQDVRGFRQLALCVPAGEPAADFLPAGPFTATFKGRLVVPVRDRYRFSFVGTGALELEVGGEVVLAHDVADPDAATSARPRLQKGEHPFVGRYRSPATGPAVMRVYWESRDIRREPVPSAALRHDATPAAAAYAQLRRGRELVQELRCGACHAGTLPARPAPPLADAGSRLRVDWMARWIADPRGQRPAATMPHLLRGPSAAGDALDIATWLSTQGRPGSGVPTTAEDCRAGAEIFADYGCVACHTLSGTHDPGGRIDLTHVLDKWHPAALVAFLQKPGAQHPGTRMPDFGFSADQARFVAGFLLTRGKPVAGSARVGDAARGKELLAEKGCASCHGVAVVNRMRAPGQPVTRGGGVACTAADFGLTADDEAALQSFLTRRLPHASTAVETAESAWRLQRCGACHARAGVPSVWSRVAGEVADLAPPDPGGQAAAVVLPPDLTHAGSKLQTTWLTEWLEGEALPRPRPWIPGPMPVFDLDAAAVARGLGHAHGFPATGGAPSVLDGMAPAAATAPADGYAPEPAPEADLLSAGARLLPQDGGFGCVNCHAVGDAAAHQVFEAPGPNLRLAAGRLRKEYFLRWMWDPTRVDPTTKMTRFIDADGMSGLTDVLGGSGAAQVEALWRHLGTLR